MVTDFLIAVRKGPRPPRSKSAVVLCLAAVIIGHATASAQQFLTDLGLGPASGLNNSGQVVLPTGVWSNGTVTAFPPNFTGNAINASGELGGVITGPNFFRHCATYSNGLITDLAVTSGIPDDCDVTGINASGQVVGYLGSGRSASAFVSSNGSWSYISGVPINCNSPYPCTVENITVAGVNDSGQVVGTEEIVNLDMGLIVGTESFIYDSVTQKATDIGPGYTNGSGPAINASGQVVGGCFIYSNGTRTEIPVAGAAINATGQVVGDSCPQGSGPVFYNGGTINLNDLVDPTDPLKPFVTYASAVSINDRRVVLMNGVDSRTQLTHAYLIQAPWFDIAPGPLTYPSQAIGTVSVAQTLTITNAGTAPLPVDSISVSGDFSQTNNCGPSLAPNEACAVAVTFGPTTVGYRTGVLTLTSAAVPAVVPLAGTATIKVAISTSAASITVGTRVQLTWTISPGALCTATGGSSADGWTGSISASGTRSVAETSAGNYSYGLSCVLGSQSASDQVSVVVSVKAVSNPPPSAGSGGGGVFDALSLFGVLCSLGVRGLLQRPATRSGVTAERAAHGHAACASPPRSLRRLSCRTPSSASVPRVPADQARECLWLNLPVGATFADHEPAPA